MLRKWVALFPLAVALITGYPLTATSVHGLNFLIWPPELDTPLNWYSSALGSLGTHVVTTYFDMALARSLAFVDGGRAEIAAVFLPALLLSILLTSGKPIGPRRALTPIYGDARFAKSGERRRMKVGLELGTDPETGRTIRVAVRGNLTTIAPPGSGKTSGLLIPNLAAPEDSAWFGPAVVIDPKGDVYRAVADRRRQLGRTVHCLDPMSLVGGGDRWNPFTNLDPVNITNLQTTADALLPTPGANETKYFREAANSIIVAAFLAVHREEQPSPLRVAQLLADQPAFAKALHGIEEVPAKATLALIENPPKNIMDLFSTAQQAFRWCEDSRLGRLTSESTFDLLSICRGDADLFLTLPTENMARLAPFIRWLLNDLLIAIHRQKPRERLIIFIDEAKVLGRFDEVSIAYGELPGHNTSLWTFWQNRAQIAEIYGDHGAASLINNSEVVTFSDPSRADPDTLDHWSRALSDFTMVEEAKTVTEATKDRAGSVSTGTTLKAVPLMSRDALASLPSSDLIAIVNGHDSARYPFLIRKTRHTDRRLRGLVTDLGGRARAG